MSRCFHWNWDLKKYSLLELYIWIRESFIAVTRYRFGQAPIHDCRPHSPGLTLELALIFSVPARPDPLRTLPNAFLFLSLSHTRPSLFLSSNKVCNIHRSIFSLFLLSPLPLTRSFAQTACKTSYSLCSRVALLSSLLHCSRGSRSYLIVQESFFPSLPPFFFYSHIYIYLFKCIYVYVYSYGMRAAETGRDRNRDRAALRYDYTQPHTHFSIYLYASIFFAYTHICTGCIKIREGKACRLHPRAIDRTFFIVFKFNYRERRNELKNYIVKMIFL